MFCYVLYRGRGKGEVQPKYSHIFFSDQPDQGMPTLTPKNLINMVLHVLHNMLLETFFFCGFWQLIYKPGKWYILYQHGTRRSR